MVTSGTAALLVVVKTAAMVELPVELTELALSVLVLPTRPVWPMLELPAVAEVAVETIVDDSLIVDVRALLVIRVVEGTEPVATGLVMELQPAGIVHTAPVQSLGIVQVSAGAVSVLGAVEVVN